jgi:hypothetical protein
MGVQMSLRVNIFAQERVRREVDTKQKTELKKRILSIPPNPKAKSLGAHGFVVRFADIGDRWSVEYHDFGTQCRVLTEAVDKAVTPLDALLRLRKALKERRIVVDKATFPLNPALVTGLKKILAA